MISRRNTGAVGELLNTKYSLANPERVHNGSLPSQGPRVNTLQVI